MEDCCAVCAETLEWVAYGSCGHREVCSTCVVRLRFIIGDRHCCICKTDCPTVFVTKELGTFTEAKSDFSEFQLGVSEGQHGKYWYHEDSQAYFDDVDHYRMIKAMCKLSCSICDNNATDNNRRDDSNRRIKFRNIGQLKGHLYHQHKMFMCSLCLEGRKVFISEQKLYNRAQLRQHISSGDSEVDGSEIERGGFVGHPICDFCKNPFYGDNELYTHMSTEHYTCHICQRQHPGQYVYYGTYDDLEVHFRHEHFLCEHEPCLAKKFVVFQSDAEMKRHNAIEHGGNMSRSKRNAALQLPVSFRYRQGDDHDQRRGRRGFHREPNQSAIQASIDMEGAEGRSHELSSGFVRLNSEHGETNQLDTFASSMDLLAISSHPEEQFSRTDATNSQNFTNLPVLEESSFPPLSNSELPEPSSRYAQALHLGVSGKLGEASFPPLPGAKDSIKPKIPSTNTFASRLNLLNRGFVKVRHSARPKSSLIYEPGPSNSAIFSEILPSSSATSQVPSIPVRSAGDSNKKNRVRHSASAPNLSNTSNSNNPPSNTSKESPASVESLHNPENFQTANKSLVQSILTGLGMDEEKYATFRTISTEYRQGGINTSEYLSYVELFGLSHLVLELARMCPDPTKQKELVDAYNANIRDKEQQESNKGKAVTVDKDGKKGKGKGKGKASDHAAKSPALADDILDQVRKLQANRLPFKDELEVLSKDGYRTSKDQAPFSAKEQNSSTSATTDDRNSAKKTVTGKDSGGESSKKNRKKFHRIPSNPANSNSADGVSVRGVWSNGAGQRLFSQSDASK